MNMFVYIQMRWCQYSTIWLKPTRPRVFETGSPLISGSGLPPPAPYLKVWIRHYSFIIKCCILWVMNFAPWWRLLYPAERWGNFTINLLWIFLLICCLFKIYKNLNGLSRQQVDQYVRLFNLKEFNTSNEHFWHEKVKTTNKEVSKKLVGSYRQCLRTCLSSDDRVNHWLAFFSFMNYHQWTQGQSTRKHSTVQKR